MFMCGFVCFILCCLHKASENGNFSERGKQCLILHFTNQFIMLQDFLKKIKKQPKTQTHTTVDYTNRKLFLWDMESIIFPV